MNEDLARARSRNSGNETHLERLYLALNKDYPDSQVKEIVCDLSHLGMAIPYLVDKVQAECGAIGASRLRRLARSTN